MSEPTFLTALPHLRPRDGRDPGADPAPASGDVCGPRLRVSFHTLGCRLNQYDTESIRTAMGALLPIEVVPWGQPADLCVLNSCTVTAKADQECRRLARQAKRKFPGAKVVVAGCYAQTQPAALAAMPEVDAVVGNTAKDDVGAWLRDVLADRGQAVRVEAFHPEPLFDSPLIDEFSGRSRAFVKIQDGCNLRCAYCLIWKARGPGRSRPVDAVLRQLRLLSEAGFRETILAGIHLGGYGRDLHPRTGLTALLETCLAEFPDLRIRLSSIHPNEVTPALLGLFQANPRLRPHLHVSLQSGSDGVLRRMKRPYRGARAWRALRDAAAVAPQFGLGADLIAGFPGETEREFEETLGLVRESPLSYLHVFRFSRRPGTAAADMPGQVPPEAIAERSAVLRDLGARKQEAFCRALVGSRREAVVETEAGRPGWRQATADNYAAVLVPQDLPTGALVNVRITDYRQGSLFAEPEGA